MKDLLVILALVFVAIVGASRSSLFHTGNPEDSNGVSATSTPTTTNNGSIRSTTTSAPVVDVNVTTPAGSVSSSALPIDDQPAGEMVVVSSVTFGAPGWVAVHDGVTGMPGNTIGASWLPAGTHTNVNVELVRPMIAGNQYFLVLHSDDGDKKYNSKIDLALSGSVPFSFRAK